jgi:hypothetical protein
LGERIFLHKISDIWKFSGLKIRIVNGDIGGRLSEAPEMFFSKRGISCLLAKDVPALGLSYGLLGTPRVGDSGVG